jgi:hypothetical protein
MNGYINLYNAIKLMKHCSPPPHAFLSSTKHKYAGWLNSMDFSTVKLITNKGKAIPLQALTGPEGSRRLI